MSDEAAGRAPEEPQDESTDNSPSEAEEYKAKLDEFRENNRKLYNELKRFEGIDPDEFRQTKSELKKLRNRLEAKDAGVEEEKIEDLLKKRHGEEIGKFRSEAETWKSKAEEATAKLSEVLLDNTVTMAAKEIEDFVGTAIPDAIRLVREQFVVKDGQAVHREGRLDENGKPLTVQKFLSLTKKQGSEVYRPHWWKATASGGGATGNTGSPGSQTMSRTDFDRMNPMQQMEFMRRVRAGKAELVDAA